MNPFSLVISILIVVLLAASVCHSMWHLSKKLVIPMQICLFILLVVMLFKTFATKENFDRLNDQVEKSGIADLEEKAVKDSAKAVGNVLKANDASTAEQTAKVEKTAEPKVEKTAEPKVEKTAEAKEDEKTAKKAKLDFTKYMQN